MDQSGFVISLLSANQDLAHQPFGGIVPEIACRNHSLNLLPLVERVLEQVQVKPDEIAGIAVTNRPGLVGSLIVGLVTAKTLAQVWQKPLLGINHLEGHILAPFLYDKDRLKPELDFPFIALAVSGGHTSLYHVESLGVYSVLGSTLDDAAGEAFDKFAKMMGLGFPGGVKVDRLAASGDPTKFNFPRSLIDEDSYQMSFSGLKSAAQRLLVSLNVSAEKPAVGKLAEDLCASFQEAIVDVLIAKLDFAVRRLGLKTVVVTGGVSANSRLRARATQWAQGRKLQLHIPPLVYCTDNAAMIAYAGALRFARGEKHELDLGPSPRPLADDFKSGTFQKGRLGRVQRT